MKKYYINAATLAAMNVISKNLGKNLQEMYEDFVSQDIFPIPMEEDYEMRYKIQHDDYDFCNLSDAQKRTAYRQYWGRYWATSKEWDQCLMQELGLKSNTKRFNIRDKAKHGLNRNHHIDKLYGGNIYTSHGPERINDIKRNMVMNELEAESYSNSYSANDLMNLSIKQLYMTVQNRMTKSIQEITLEILDMLAHYELTAEVLDYIENEVDTLFHNEVNYMYYLKWYIETKQSELRRLELGVKAKKDIISKAEQELWEVMNK